MIRFPYGISDFHRIRSDNYLYLDRTAYIAELEEAGRQLIFSAPAPVWEIIIIVDISELLRSQHR